MPEQLSAREIARRNKERVQRLQRRHSEEKASVPKTGTKSRSSLGMYEQFCYGLVGERLDQKERRRLQDRLKQADFNLTSGMYLGMRYVTTALIFFVALPILVGLFYALFAGVSGLLWGGAVGLVATFATFVAFPMVVGQRIGNRRGHIEKELPFSLSELAVLATIGLSPIQLMEKMGSREHDPAMTSEFRKVHYKATVQGKDLVGALAETAKEAPSEELRETFWDLGNMMHQGGDLGPYLRDKAHAMLEKKRVRQKAFIEQLGGYADMFVTVALIGVIFLAIGAFIMDAFGNTAGGLGAKQIMQMLTYGFMPMVVFVVGLLISTAYSRYQ